MPVNITADKAIRHTVLGMRANLHTVFVCIKSPHIYVMGCVTLFCVLYPILFYNYDYYNIFNLPLSN